MGYWGGGVIYPGEYTFSVIPILGISLHCRARSGRSTGMPASPRDTRLQSKNGSDTWFATKIASARGFSNC